ncbi:MAG: indolepyruvate oxidoreductase subunit beta [Ignavibacteriales bacterium]|nr:indolepyruvate oxidoreductase subunit beta [Ignavibacteriales bacterium]
MNSSIKKNLLFSGVGGQGILLISELTARAAIHAGFDVKKTEVHGAAQRGGSVVSHVRFSQKVYSPLSKVGDVDILLSLEKLEGLRWAHYVKDGGIILLNNEERSPQPMTEKKVEYPQNIEEFLSSKRYNVQTIDAISIASEMGNYRAANTILLGAMASHTEIADEHWLAVMKENLNPKILELNLKAFERGKELTYSSV